MIRAALALALLGLLSGCAGTATYHVRPFYDRDSKQIICCEASISNSKDIASVQVSVQKKGDDYSISFAETGVNASAPITAQSADVTGVAGAVGTAAAAVIKVTPTIP